MNDISLEWTATVAVIPHIVSRLKKIGVNATPAQVHTLLLGGGAPMGEFIEQLEKMGNFDSGASEYAANLQFWQCIGVSKAMFEVFCEAGA